MIAACQRLMLLAHASVSAGMKLVGFRYGQPKYVIPYVPPYCLIVTCVTTRQTFLSYELLQTISRRPSWMLWQQVSR